MKMTMGAREFRALLKTPARLADGSKGVHAATRYVLVSATKDAIVNAAATDTDLRISVSETALSVPEAGAAMVPADLLRGILDVLPDGSDVTLSGTAGEVRIEAGGEASWKLATIPADEFPLPETPEIARPLEVTGKTGAILAALSEVLYASPVSDPRRILQSVAFDLRVADEPRIVATDGKVMAAAGLDGLTLKLEGETRVFCAPRPLVEFAAHVLADDAADAFLGFGERRVTISGPSGDISAQMPEGKFPDWRVVVPKSFNWHLSVNRAALTLEANRAGRISQRDKKIGGRPVILRFEDSTCHVSAMAQDKGSYKSKLALKTPCEPGPIEVCFGAEMLIETLAHCNGDEVTLCMNGPHGPAVFSGSDDGAESLRVLMPIKLAEVVK